MAGLCAALAASPFRLDTGCNGCFTKVRCLLAQPTRFVE